MRFQPRLSLQESTIYCYMKNGRHLHGGQVAILIIINLAMFAITLYFTLGISINDVTGSVVLAIITLFFFCMTFLDEIFSWMLSHCYSNQVVVQYRFTSMKNNLNVKKKISAYREGHAFVHWKGRSFLFGGKLSRENPIAGLASIHELEMHSKEWKSFDFEMQSPRLNSASIGNYAIISELFLFSMIDCGNRGILILGGWANLDNLNTTECFDGINRPIAGPVMLNKHQLPSAVCVKGKLFITIWSLLMVVFIGKVYVLGSNSNSCEVLDLHTSDSTFELIAERPKIQIGPAICVMMNQVWLLGGINLFMEHISMVQRYDIATNSWTSMDDLKISIYRDYPCFVRGHEVLIYKISGELLERYNLD